MVASFVERRREPLGNTFVNVESGLAASLGLEVARRKTMRAASCPVHLDESWQSDVRTPGRERPSVVLEEASTTGDSPRCSPISSIGASPQTPAHVVTFGIAATPSTTMASAAAAGRRMHRGRRGRGFGVRSGPLSLFTSLGEDAGNGSGASAAMTPREAAAALGAAAAAMTPRQAAAELAAAAADSIADREWDVKSATAPCISHMCRRSDPKPTTLMIRNLPVEVRQQEFQREVDESGFEGQYDFLHVPVALCSGVSKGFAFVNFRTAEAAARFQSSWHKQTRFGALNVSAAAIQGQAGLIENWSTPKNRRIRNPKFRPFILPTDRPEKRDGSSRFGGCADPEPHVALSAWHGAAPATASSPSFVPGNRSKARAVGSVAPSAAATFVRSQI